MRSMDEKSERSEKSSIPKEPSEPLESLEPSEPLEPKESLEPSEPLEPNKPLKPSEPLEPDKKEGPIRERFEKLYSDEKFKEIINFEEIKKGELYVNIIHYDKDIRKEENIKYYRYFSIDTIGGYYPFDDFDMIKLFITKLNEMPYKCSYIIIISGNEIEKILE